MNRSIKVPSVVYIVVGLLAFMLGSAILLVPEMLGPMDNAMRYFFVAMLMAYGIYRMYFGISQMKKRDENPRIR